MAFRRAGWRRVVLFPKQLLILAALVPHGMLAQTEPTEGETGTIGLPSYAEGRPISVVPRKEELIYFPCSDCHEFMEVDTQVRELEAPHVSELNHGEERLWCLTCHVATERDYLATIMGERVDFDDAHLICATCHGNRHRDWYLGGHGKRVGGWQGERTVYGCTHCHDAHEPAIKPREPKPPPPIRAGLEREEGSKEPARPSWEHQGSTEGSQSGDDSR